MTMFLLGILIGLAFGAWLFESGHYSNVKAAILAVAGAAVAVWEWAGGLF